MALFLYLSSFETVWRNLRQQLANCKISMKVKKSQMSPNMYLL